jgi:hypothetical protein
MKEERLRAVMAFSGTFRKLGMRYLANAIQRIPEDPRLSAAILTASKHLSAALEQLRGEDETR